MTEVELVWEEWRKRQKRPDLVRLTAERRRLISARIKLGYSADDLCALVAYAYESDDDRPRFWRGETGDGPDSRTYLDLENLFRVHKLGERVPAALEWREGGDGGPNDDGSGGSAPVQRSARRSPASEPEEESEGGSGRYGSFRSPARRTK